MITGFWGGCRFDSSSGLSMWSFPVLMAAFFMRSNFSLESKSSLYFLVCLSLSLSLSLFSFILHLLGVIICYLSGAFKCMPPALEAQPSVQPPLCSFTEGREWFKARCLFTLQVLHFSPSQQSSYHLEKVGALSQWGSYCP